MERKTWQEIVKEYPDRWVALSNCEMDGSAILSGVVESVCTEENRYNETVRLQNEGVKFRWRRTTFLKGANVICRI